MTNWKKSLTAVVLVTLVLSLLVGGTASALFVAPPSPTYNGIAPKYVFLFIGDGMSYPQISSAEMFLGKKANLSDLVGGGGLSKLSFSQFPRRVPRPPWTRRRLSPIRPRPRPPSPAATKPCPA